MRNFAILALVILVAGCSTQRFGRLTPLSETEKQTLSCREIAIEIAKAEEFLFQTRSTRNNTNALHVLGALGDFGIGNVMEGNAAEQSGEVRLKDLKDLNARKAC
jgi:hypothetical protein